MFYKKILGLDIDDNHITAVLMSKRGNKTKLLAFNRSALPPHIIEDGQIKDKERLVESIKKLLETANPIPIQSCETVCSIPETKIFVHTFGFHHNISNDEIAKAIPLEAEKVIPFPSAQTYFDLQDANEDGKKAVRIRKNVIYASIPKEIADAYLETLEACELKPIGFSLESSSLAKSLIPIEEKKDATLILNFEASLTSFVIFDSESLQKVDNIPVGGTYFNQKIAKTLNVEEEKIEELKENQKIKEDSVLKELTPDYKKIALSAQKIAQEYEKNSPKKIKKIILCGNALDTPGLVEFMIKNLKPKAEIGDPWKEVKIIPSHFSPFEKKDEMRKTKAVAFAAAIGLAINGLISPPTHEINIIPQRVKEYKEKKRRNMIIHTIAIILILISCINLASFFMVWGKLFYDYRKVQNSHNTIENITNSKKYQELKANITEFNKEVNLLANLQRNIFSVPQMINEIQEYIPENITLTSIKYDDAKSTINISGIAPKREDILETQNSLLNLPFAEEIHSPLSNLDPQKDISFVIKIKLDTETLPIFGSK